MSVKSEFMDLFRGNKRSVGVYLKRGGHRVDKDIADLAARFENHFNGGDGVGIIPITDMGTCYFGAIDIDNHGRNTDGTTLDISKLAHKVKAFDLPLVLCQSKSGGIHAFLFMSEPVPAVLVNRILTVWTTKLHGTFTNAMFDSVYPKQTSLVTDKDGVVQYGNFINLPYYNDNNEPTRVCHTVDGPVSLAKFVEIAKANMQTEKSLQRLLFPQFDMMPPCLQCKAASGGFMVGERNEGMFQAVVFAKKLATLREDVSAYPAIARELAAGLCANDPISKQELETIIKSNKNRDYQYKCSSPQFKEVCDSAKCKTMPCGITDNDNQVQFEFKSVIQYVNVDPPTYDLTLVMEGQEHLIKQVTHRNFCYYNELKLVAFKYRLALPPMKQADWEKILIPLLKSARLEELPEEATPTGLLKSALHEFCAMADMSSGQFNHMAILTRGMPALVNMPHGQYVAFRAADFQRYVKAKRTDVPGSLIDHWYLMASKIGMIRFTLGTGKSKITVWGVISSDLPKRETPQLKVESEF